MIYFHQKIPAKSIALFFHQLATLISANIPLAQSFQLLSQSQSNDRLKIVIRALQRNLEAGRGLSHGLKKFPHTFSDLICHLVHIGEVSGTLEHLLHQIANLLKKSILIKNQIRQALFYPLIVLTIALLVCLMMLVFIVPRFADFFQTMHGTLPLLTRITLRLSLFIREDYLMLGAIFISIIACLHLLQRLFFIKQKYHWVTQLPLISYFSSRFFILYFVKNLALIYAAGMSLTDGLTLIAKTCRLPIHQKTLYKLREKIYSGQQLHISIKHCSLFPPVVMHMIRIGEESGTLHTMLTALEDLFDTELNTTIAKMNQLLEPLIMVILGALIGGLVIAMYLPLFKLGTMI